MTHPDLPDQLNHFYVISSNLKRDGAITCIIKKAQEGCFFCNNLKNVNLPQTVLVQFTIIQEWMHGF